MGFFDALKEIAANVNQSLKIRLNFRMIMARAIVEIERKLDVSSTFEYNPSKDVVDSIAWIKKLISNNSLVHGLPDILDDYQNALKKIKTHNENLRKLFPKLIFSKQSILKDPIQYSHLLKNIEPEYKECKSYKVLDGLPKDFVKDYEECKKKAESIVKAFVNYINESKIKLDEFALIGELPKEVEPYLASFDSSLEYKSIINEYNALKSDIAIHNKEIESLTKIIEDINFNKKQFLNNPLDFKKDYFEQYEEYIAKCLYYKKIPKSLSDKINDIDFANSNYHKIMVEFSLYHELKSEYSDLKDKYYDQYEIAYIKEHIKNSLIRIKSGEETIYDFKSLIKTNEQYEQHNQQFIKQHLNDNFFDNINGKSLDISQRYAVLENPVSELTVAGAGSGKTLTICAKVKYLLDNNLAKPEDILLLTYSKNSSMDLQERIEKISKDIKVSTFHSLGLAILTSKANVKQCIDDQGLDRAIHSYFNDVMYKDSRISRMILTYYGLYLQDCDYSNKHYESKGEHYEDLKRNDLRTLKTQLRDMSDPTDSKITFKREHVKSYEELIIANYYFINGIDYEYEGKYKEEFTADMAHRQYCPDFTLKKYGIYHEHYGINKQGKCPQYCHEEEQEYLQSIKWKRWLHSTNKTKCIETFSYEFKDGTVFSKINNALEKYGIKKNPLSNEEIHNVMKSIYQGRNFESFIKLLSTFISLYKSRYRDETMFAKLKQANFGNGFDRLRSKLFLEIAEAIYVYYMSHLREQDKIDFDDMILMAKDQISSLPDSFKYKYVIVDEFQDISYSRMEFLKSVINHGCSKLYAVGDDWQAIYRFSGCDLNIFLNFKDYFKYAKINNIVNTHRNAQEIQDVVEPFITKNPEQFKKHINSDYHLKNPIKLYYYDDSKLGALMTVMESINKIRSDANILILGRNNKDLDRIIEDTQLIEKKGNGKVIFKDYPKQHVEYKTVHSSKGLESDYVILINAENSKYGFPNKVEDDKILSLVLSDKSNYPYAEERRLWYVALTRTKKNTYILVDKNNPSEFINEIADQCECNYENIAVEKHPLYCPHCKTGKMVIRENGKDHRRFYGCSNYPYCNYTNNDVEAVQKEIRCPVCGYYLERRKGRYGSFLRCTNKKCNYRESLNK